MTDPVSRAARRQNLIDALAEHLTGWGCPRDTAGARAQQLLLVAEHHGWTLPAVDAPALSGRGSTREGRELARRIAANSRAGCRCEPWNVARALPADEHPRGCPVRDALELEQVQS